MDKTDLFHEIQIKLANKSLILFAIISPLLLGLALFRIIDSGWDNIFIFYSLIAISVVFSAVFRKKISYSLKINSIILIGLLISIVSFLKFGIAGQGSLLLAIVVLYLMIFYGWKYSLFSKILILFILLIIAFANYFDWVDLSPENNPYLSTPLGVTIYLIFTGVYLFLVITITESFTMALSNQTKTEYENNCLLNKLLLDKNIIENKLIDARNESEKSNQAKSDFISSMSHELRTPMNAILGFSQIMRDDFTLSDINKTYINEILRAGDHLLDLINEVLDLSKIEAGRIKLLIKPVEVSSIVDECLTLMKVLAQKHNISIYKKGEIGAVISADETRLKQVLINLISNSIKYNRNGGSVTVNIQIVDKKILRISVKDSGYGIPKEQISEIFLPFSRLSQETSKIEGTGIGLTLTKQMVELMNGEIGVISEIGKGSTFFIDFPIEFLQKCSFDKELLVHNNYSLNNNSLYTILYIDDNPANLKLMKEIIRPQKDIQFISSHTPELGFELAQSSHFDIIFMDLDLLGIDGYQILEIFKADTTLANIPIIAVTSETGPQYLEYGKAIFDEYLKKPLDIDKFLQTLNWFLK